MRLIDDLYVYPWLSYEANNANTIFIDGALPAIVDPGHAALFGHVREGMARDGKLADSVGLVIATHSHPDHIEALQLFDKDVLRAISKEECGYLEGAGRDLYMMTGSQFPGRPFHVFLGEGVLRLGDKTLRVIPTPGHSPGGICLFWDERRALISGDTVFYMGVGRTDFEGGNPDLLRRSVERLAALDAEYLVPGHGQVIKGAKAVEKNFTLILGEFF